MPAFYIEVKEESRVVFIVEAPSEQAARALYYEGSVKNPVVDEHELGEIQSVVKLNELWSVR